MVRDTEPQSLCGDGFRGRRFRQMTPRKKARKYPYIEKIEEMTTTHRVLARPCTAKPANQSNSCGRVRKDATRRDAAQAPSRTESPEKAGQNLKRAASRPAGETDRIKQTHQ